MREFIPNIAELRKKKSLTQKQVAMLTGIPLPILRMIERGKVILDPDDPRYLALCQLLELHP